MSCKIGNCPDKQVTAFGRKCSLLTHSRTVLCCPCRNLPGSPSFHVWWTGVAEILGGVGIVLGALDLPFTPDWLLPASSFGLFLLVTVVSPANMYMWTHNAPGPLTDEDLAKYPDNVLPLPFHIGRAALQVVLLSTFLGLAFHNY